MIDAYHPQAMSQPYSSSNTLNPQQWNPSVQRYREPNDHMLGHAGGDHSPSPHVISPELSPHLHHSDYSPSPPGQDRLQPVNGSGPGPTTWENMQQRQQQEQQTRNMEMQRYGNNVSPSEMLENVMIGGDGSGPNSGEGRPGDQSLPGHHHRMQPQYHQTLPSNRGLEDDSSANSIKHEPPADETYRGEQMDFDGYQIYRGGTIINGDGDRGRGLKQYRETRTKYQDGRLGILPPDQPRDYSAIKLVGDGSFGTVWLCDWKSEIPSTTVLSAMQCGAGARPEWTGKRLVAVKRMKRVWEGGWEQASKIGELVSLREIPHHPAIIPLYDAFLQPGTKELYFVFECMEGNLYQLTKSRKGRNLAAGLIASIFRQVAEGLHHIHQNGYFHRDLKPENLLVTTTGLQTYLPVVDPENSRADLALLNVGKQPPERPSPKLEKDVTVIVKLADFGLAKSLEAKPPFTEYVSTRWYRAPEVLLRSKEYSAPVDMWALGTILAELLNLKALFPGQSEIDQCWRINSILGDPSPDYGHDERGMRVGGGEWVRGLKLAKNVGYGFPKNPPVVFASLFSPAVPTTLIDCIRQLLRYNPKHRLTSGECLNHPYFKLVTPHLQANVDLPQIPFSRGQPGRAELDEIFQNMEQQRQQRIHDVSRTSSIPPRNEPPSHSHSPVHEPPNFNLRDSGRVLPPLAVSPHNNRSYHVSPERPRRYDSPNLHTSSASTSQTLLPNLSSYNNGASALVESLRELDLPTADLSTYGHRSLSPGHGPEWQQRPAPVPHPSGDRQGHSDRRSSDLVGLQAMSLAVGGTASRSSFHHSTSGHVSYTQDSTPQPQYQRNYLPPHMSTPTALASGLSPRGSFDSLRDHNSTDSLPRPREDHDVVMQDAFDEQPVRDTLAMETDTHPYRPQPGQDQARSQAFANTTSRLTNLAATGKKKKWGLSAVFSSLNDSKAELQVPPPGNIVSSGFSSAALKRTQSGITAAERAVMSQADLASGADPKKVKKEMEKQAKEQEKQLQVARRKAMEDAQKERARAVMAKRSQLVENRSNNKSEIEWTTLSTIDSASMKTSNTSQTSIPMPDGSKSQSAQDLIPKREPYMGASKTAGSRSQPSIRSQLESMSQSQIDRRQMEMSGPDAYRFKARKMDFGDDHTGYRNASVLSVGTIDSDPGPTRSPRIYQPNDPRAASAQSFARSTSSFAQSSTSVDRQLASDFRMHATVQPSGLNQSYTSLPGAGSRNPFGSGSNSSLSLGRYASSVSVSGPTTPYSHPYGHAVAAGHGIGRKQVIHHTHQQLPSIHDISKDWDGGQDVHMDGANPTYRVDPPDGRDGYTTLPPFAHIASLADSQPKGP